MSSSGLQRQPQRQPEKQPLRDATTYEDKSNKNDTLVKTIGWGAAGLVVGGLSAWMGALYFGYMVSEIAKIGAVGNGLLSAVIGGAGGYDAQNGGTLLEFLKLTAKGTAVNAASSVVGYGLFAAAMPMTVTMGQAAWAIAVGACITSVGLSVLLACGYGLYSLTSRCCTTNKPSAPRA